MELEEEEQIPETPAVRSNLLLDSEGRLREHYEACHFTFESGGTDTVVYFIPITEVEGGILAAVPFLAWHRSIARRLLPPGALSRPVLIEVAGEEITDTETVETTVKVWVGVVKEDLIAAANVGEAEEPGALEFGEELGPGQRVVPSAEALIEVADEHFAFTTAASGEPAKRPTPKRKARGPTMEHRVSSLEDGIKQIQQVLTDLPEKLRQQKTEEPKTKGKTTASTGVRAGGEAEVFTIPGLDPGSVAAARAAGIGEEQLQTLGKLFSKQGRMTEPAARKKTRKDVLSESEEDAGPEEEEGAEVAEAANPIEKAVVQLTKLVANMSKGKGTRGGLEGILEKVDAGGSGSDAASSGGGSRSKAAAYKKLKDAMENHPEWIYQSIETLMDEDYNLMRTLPGGNLLPTTSRGWVEHRSRILHYPSTIRMAWCLAGVHDALKSNNIALARAKAALGLAAVDQASLDGGSWALAQELLLENAPPYQSFQNKRAPDVTEQIATRLIEERFLEVALWRLKDRDSYLESRRRLAAGNRPKTPGGEDRPAPNPSPNPKKQPRPKKGGGRGGQEEAAPQQ